MSGKHRIMFSVIVCCFTVFQLTARADAAGRGRHDGPPRHEYHHPYRGIVVPFLPDLIAKLIIYGGQEYYYDDGYFYRKSPDGFIIIDPPVGAVVRQLPRGYKIIVTSGRSYFYYNDTYYLRTRGGYLVTDNPVYQIVEPPVETFKVAAEPVLEPAAEAGIVTGIYSVNIPNTDGTYTEVTLKKTKDGFIGPQGELYRKFPAVQQLKVMYGK